MCGISCIINQKNFAVEQNEIKRMNDLIAHRGPDSEGFYHGSNFSLGHRRLSIIGLGKEGHQPMDFQSKYILSFNGEIYNYIEIKLELEKTGYTFNTNTDTEVILAAYDKWGDKCVDRFNGMWSFVIYNIADNILFCSRDRFGIKPFYFSETNSKFVFGSEIKQILPFLKKVEVNKELLIDFLIVGFEEHTNNTFFKDVVKLPAGSNLTYDLSTHKYEIKSYYTISINQSNSSLNEQDSVKLYKSVLEDAIKLRMRSDVKVGTCLSGGLDSSSVSAISAEIYNSEGGNNKFNAIHAKSTEKNTDESNFAQQVGEHCNLNLNVLEPTIEDFKSKINEVIYTQEEPFGSPSIFMQYFVMEKAKEINCKVMLDGQGGDETLLGYEKYYPAYLLSLGGVKMVKEFFNSSKNSKLSKIDLLKYSFYFTKYGIRKKLLERKNRFIKTEYIKNFESKRLKELSNSYLNIEKLQKFEIKYTQLPHLLKYEDKNSMRNSIETRLPFIDYKVLETALSIKHQFKINNGWTKYVLRKAVENILPKTIVWRKNKLGFNAPETSWLNSLEPEMLKELKGSKILNEVIDFSKLSMGSITLRSKWKLYNIAKWEQLYDVKIS
jgi:asparagine synthase (glutamine-hydrolysing)